MANFNKRQVKNLTLSEYLKNTRETLQLSEGEFASRSNVPRSFIETFESGDYSSLPADVYTIGHLRSIADFLKLESEPLISQYKKEKILYRFSFKQTNFKSSTRLPRVFLGPKSMIAIITGTVLLAFASYIIYQIILLNQDPKLVILTPKDTEVISTHLVNIKGATDPGNQVTINGTNIPVAIDGSFETKFDLPEGKTSLDITTKNRLGNQAEEQINLIINPSAVTSKSFEATFHTTNREQVTLIYDGIIQETSIIKPLTIKAADYISILSSNPSSIQIKYKDKELGNISQIYSDTQSHKLTRDTLDILYAKPQ